MSVNLLLYSDTGSYTNNSSFTAASLFVSEEHPIKNQQNHNTNTIHINWIFFIFIIHKTYKINFHTPPLAESYLELMPLVL